MLWHTYAHDFNEYYEGAQYSPFPGKPTDKETQLQLVISRYLPEDIKMLSVDYSYGQPAKITIKTDKTEYTIVPIVQR